MTDEELALRSRLMRDFVFYAPRVLRIRTKRGDVKPFRPNRAQTYLHELLEGQRQKTGRVRALVLKGRQQGISTYVAGRFFWRVTHTPGCRAFILTHEAEATANLFDMAKRYLENCPEIVRPQVGADSSRELTFPGLDSGYKVGTAGNKGVGRSNTVQLFHGSEVGFWPNADEHAKGILQAVPQEPGTEIILESTANGVGNYFHQQWQAAEAGMSDFLPVFLPWYWQDEYRREVPEDFDITDEETEIARQFGLDDEQIYWRRMKIVDLAVGGGDGVMSFRQEYPNTSAEAFISSGGEYAFIRPELVLPARKPVSKPEPFGSIVVGVDPARFGDDRTAIIRRQGRVAYGAETHEKRDLMDTVGRVVGIITEERPARVFIDVGGLGAGVIDRLREIGYGAICVPVNSGEKPFNQERYVNRRAEMWGEMRAWLDDGPVEVPDRDDLQADLCGPQFKYDSKSRVQLESKEDMKKRKVRSPDLGDALALTFSQSVPLDERVEIEAESLATY